MLQAEFAMAEREVQAEPPRPKVFTAGAGFGGF